MAYSSAFSQGISIVLFVSVKMHREESYKYCSTKYIASALGMPACTATKVIRSLVSAGILGAREGAKGGLIALKRPQDISLLSIFSAINGEQPVFKPIGGIKIAGKEVDEYVARIDAALTRSEGALKAELGSISIAELM
jgi:DNA-binding IscR family transcriptional regulator